MPSDNDIRLDAFLECIQPEFCQRFFDKQSQRFVIDGEPP
jgi:hypothetical protein